jgi:hypothetical protein
MHDGIECCQCLRVGQHRGSKTGPVQGPVRAQHFRAEALDDLLQRPMSRRLCLPHQLIGVDDRGAPAAKQLGNRRLSGAHVSG